MYRKNDDKKNKLIHKRLIQKTIVVFLIFVLLLSACNLTACNNNSEEETSETTSIDKSDPKYGFGEKTSGALSFIERHPDDFVTAVGITVPKDPRWSFGDFIPLLDMMDLDGKFVEQDGSWEFIDADETVPQRGDIVVYTTTELGGFPSHCSVCVYGYDGFRYMNIDGNYGDEPGGVKRGYSVYEEPNKMWPDSYMEAPGTEVGIGVWRSTADGYGETLAQASEQMLDEYKAAGQYPWLNEWIPEIVYGSWCYYTIAVAVNLIYENEHGLESRTAVGTIDEDTYFDEIYESDETETTHAELKYSINDLNYEGDFDTSDHSKNDSESTDDITGDIDDDYDEDVDYYTDDVEYIEDTYVEN